MSNSCFTCIHQNIMETSDEWIECKCKLDGVWRDPFCGCEHCENSSAEYDSNAGNMGEK